MRVCTDAWAVNTFSDSLEPKFSVEIGLKVTKSTLSGIPKALLTWVNASFRLTPVSTMLETSVVIGVTTAEPATARRLPVKGSPVMASLPPVAT
ncbi:hypothetical protein SR1949_53120 [Sphaerospermopsis reniformis]|uniref:Uncharacterized protein n=1 Tax=Sphaerospermopsis reniformis TaxID=531300 RepID=A0A480AA53_9CYAN|nr:hypothetical protein SR1949_53120 [Sphaerospermopsis reniformis]